LFQHGLANLGSKKTITVSNHFGNMDFVLYDSNGLLVTGRAKLLSDTKEKLSEAKEKKVAFVFKYDRSGILSVSRAEAILSLPDPSNKEVLKENSYAMELLQELHGPKFMNRTQKANARKLKDTFISIDKKIEAKKTARNDLEAAVYSMKTWMEEEENHIFLNSDTERSNVGTQLEAEIDWMENEGYDETIEVYKQRKADLDKVIKPIKNRKARREMIKKELKNLERKINEIENKYEEYIAKREWLPDTEKVKVSKYIEDCLVYL
jgi:molecular chaperone DnaK (HSP70)